MSGDTPVPPLLAAHVGRELGHSRRVLSAPPEAIRVPSGLNATLYTSGYVECAPTAGSGKGAASGITSSLTWTCPTAGSPRAGTATAPSTGRWCGDESPHQKGAPQAQERQEVIHINTDWRGRAKPGPWYGRYYEEWDAAHPTAWVRGQAVPGRFYAGALWGSSTLAWDAAWFRAHGVKMTQGAHYVVPGHDKIPLTDKLDPTDTGVMRLQFR